MLGLVRPERGAHAHGLFVATTLLSVVLTPLAIEVINVLYGEDLHLSPLTVASVAVGALLLPLGIGLVIGRFFPAAKRWVPAIQQASGRLFLLCLVGFTILWLYSGRFPQLFSRTCRPRKAMKTRRSTIFDPGWCVRRSRLARVRSPSARPSGPRGRGQVPRNGASRLLLARVGAPRQKILEHPGFSPV